MRSVDVVIVGGGIAGGALATALANDGLRVTVLEASAVYRDRVRGESLAPWGVREAHELGVEQILLDAGAHIAAAWVQYDASVPSEVSEAHPILMARMVPDVPGSLNLRHPEACVALAQAAVRAGAEVVRSVSDLEVTPGRAPTVRFSAGGQQVELAAGLVVGADGRHSIVRRQAGIRLCRQPEVHMMAGLLLEDLGCVPPSAFIASEGDLFMVSFLLGGGRLRVYLCPGLSDRHRFGGPNGIKEFLLSSAFGCLPFGEDLARAQVAGPLATYPGDDSWTEEPFVDGVVLIGDAAGYNNPLIGQGLSISMRDARGVREVVRGGNVATSAFTGYGVERMERMRRLRHVASVMAAAFAEDGVDRAARRARFFELHRTEPLMAIALLAPFRGPEAAPPEAFDGRLLAAMQTTG